MQRPSRLAERSDLRRIAAMGSVWIILNERKIKRSPWKLDAKFCPESCAASRSTRPGRDRDIVGGQISHIPMRQ